MMKCSFGPWPCAEAFMPFKEINSPSAKFTQKESQLIELMDRFLSSQSQGGGCGALRGYRGPFGTTSD